MMSDWIVEFDFKLSGRKAYGGDGFAFWFTEQKSLMGHVFGSADYWKGLAIIFDTYNNDGKGESPFIAAIDNDGTQSYDASQDGSDAALASCSMAIRNKESSARISYIEGLLTLELSLGHELLEGQSRSSLVKDYKKCFELKVELGVDKYFGLSAHTGDVADSHDIFSITTTDHSPLNVDLSVIRERYRMKIMRDQSKPMHENLSVNDFQHLVLNLLHQEQEALAIVEEMTQTHYKDIQLGIS